MEKSYKHIPEKEFEIFTNNDELFEKALKENKEATEPLRFIPIKSVECIIYEQESPKRKEKYQLKYWGFDKVVSVVVKCIFEKHGFKPTQKFEWNIMMTSRFLNLGIIRKMNQYQRISRFPNCHEITRKDKMYTNHLKMKRRFPQEFDYIPLTFRLPNEYPDFVKHFVQNEKSVWIVKPSKLSRGRGISLITSPKMITKKMMKENYVCSKYIDDPYLINGMKFDMRIYVFVTSYLPLRIYIYNDSLIRFATEKYKNEEYENLFRHVTNVTINSKNPNYVTDENNETNWTLNKFKKYMIEEMGVDFEKIEASIKDIVIKSLLSVEDIIVSSIRKDLPYRNNSFQIFGYDMMLDSKLKVHLLEVNLDPSLASNYPLKVKLNSSMLASLFDMLQIRAYDPMKVKDAPYHRITMSEEIQNEKKNEDDELTIVEKMIINESEEEISKRGGWNLVFPSKDSESYDRFFFEKRKINTVLRKNLFKS